MRGDIYRLRTPRDTQDHEQRGPRYCVIVQSDVVLRSTVLIAPTSRGAEPSTIRPEINMDGTKTLILIEQTSAVSTGRLGDHAGRLNVRELAELNDAIRIVFGIY